jgi:hypothetical protein
LDLIVDFTNGGEPTLTATAGDCKSPTYSEALTEIELHKM